MSTKSPTVSNNAPQNGDYTIPIPGKMVEVPGPPVFEEKHQEQAYLKGRLATAFRIFADQGFDEGVAGHITLRDPIDPTTFWVNPFGLAFSLITVSTLIQVSHTGAVLAGGPNRLLNTAAFMIHAEIHAARPDVICIAHAHSIHGRAFSTLCIPLATCTQDDCVFYDDLALYENYRGIVLERDEGRDIAKCLGGKKAAILVNHGLLTVGKTVEEAVFWFVGLEKCCRVQLMARGAGTVREIERKDAEYTNKVLGTSSTGYFCGKPLFDVMEKRLDGAHL